MSEFELAQGGISPLLALEIASTGSRRGTQSYDESKTAVPFRPRLGMMLRMIKHVRHFVDWRKLKCVWVVGSHVRGKITPSGKPE